VIEASLETYFSWIGALGLRMVKEKKYKTNQHVFLKKKQESDTADVS
jgi:16S rRNA (guanine966-N2)-methyltransferase